MAKHGKRKYLPTLADLIDRLSISYMKSIFIPENKSMYMQEIDNILYDIDLILKQKKIKVKSDLIRDSMLLMLINRYIWENEDKARKGGSEQDKLLKLTHSINGIRNAVKNTINFLSGDKLDLKIDCFAGELLEEFGNWKVYE